MALLGDGAEDIVGLMPWSRRGNRIDRIRRGQLRHIGPGEGRKFGNGLEDTVGTPLEVNCPEGAREGGLGHTQGRLWRVGNSGEQE